MYKNTFLFLINKFEIFIEKMLIKVIMYYNFFFITVMLLIINITHLY